MPAEISPNHGSWTDDYRYLSGNAYNLSFQRYLYKNLFFTFLPERGAQVLDVGCGNGRLLLWLNRQGYKNIYGVEPDPILRETLALKSPENFGDHIKNGLATDLPFPEKSFDCISSFNVLHHLKSTKDYHLAAQEIDRCLAPGGKVIIVEPWGRYIYEATLLIARALAPYLRACASIYSILSQERKEVDIFFSNYLIFREDFQSMGYNHLKDLKLFHQWIMVSQKPY